jgi:hypothetical protein
VPNPVGGDGKWAAFPNPPLSAGAKAQHDYLPLALESLPLAFVDVAVSARIDPVECYRRLRAVGTSGGGGLEAYETLNKELLHWIERGTLPQGAPTPPPAHAGSAGDDWKLRREAVLSRVESLATVYHRLFQEQERRSEPEVLRAYELRGDIMGALADLVHAVREHDAAAFEGDIWN